MRNGLINILLLVSVLCSAQIGRYPFSKARPDTGPDSLFIAEVVYYAENNSNDETGNGWNGSYAGGYNASYSIQGEYSIFLNSSTNLFTVGDYDIDNDTIAISFWYLHRSGYSSNSAAQIAASGNTTNGWSLEMDQGNGDLEFHKYVSGTDYEARTPNSTFANTDTWYHIIIQTHGNGGGYCDMYVDGADADTDNITDASGTFDTGQITMGGNTSGTGTCVDNIAFFNMFLTSDQRTYLYNHPETTLKVLNE